MTDAFEGMVLLSGRNPVTGCLEYTKGLGSAGYAQVTVGRARVYAHRLSYNLNYGPIPDDMEVLHSCDNPPCIEPTHLRVGTHKENMEDMSSRKRYKPNPLPGQTNPMSKLTEEAVRDIRVRYLRGERQADIGSIYGVSQSIISRVHLRKSWGFVSD